MKGLTLSKVNINLITKKELNNGYVFRLFNKDVIVKVFSEHTFIQLQVRDFTTENIIRWDTLTTLKELKSELINLVEKEN